jgi:hypothetical protein
MNSMAEMFDAPLSGHYNNFLGATYFFYPTVSLAPETNSLLIAPMEMLACALKQPPGTTELQGPLLSMATTPASSIG